MRSPYAVVSLLFLGAAMAIVTLRDAKARSPCPDRPPPPTAAKPAPWPSELPRDWTDDEGKDMRLFNPATGEIELEYVSAEPNCPTGDHRKFYLKDATFDGINLRGKMVRCTATQELLSKCASPPTFETDFYTISITRNQIAGYYRSEWLEPIKEPKAGQCPYARNPSGDGWCPFTLTFGGPPPCADTAAAVQLYSAVVLTQDLANQAQHAVSDPDLRSSMSATFSALGAIELALDGVISAETRCKDLHDSIAPLQKFGNAISEVNSARCGRQLAAGFDHLLAVSSELGERLVHLPELAPAFQALGSIKSLYRDPAGKLDAELRWGAQFGQIRGYQTPNC